MYYYFVMANGRDKELAREIEKLVPELAYENIRLLKDKKIFIFGSGDFGGRAINILGNNVIGFIDNDKEKIGKKKQTFQLFLLMNIVVNIKNRLIY